MRENPNLDRWMLRLEKYIYQLTFFNGFTTVANQDIRGCHSRDRPPETMEI
ncbi:MAG: hypothetical protein K9N34_08070 [Candidatus Marinimicrobia bacterium]|nr:hypothetical protein [Candidatus Neomarinimicrobiota bacterium]